MKELKLEFGDLSGHPPPPQVDLGVYERWVFDVSARTRRGEMTTEKLIEDFLKNEGRQTEPWPDFGNTGG